MEKHKVLYILKHFQLHVHMNIDPLVGIECFDFKGIAVNLSISHVNKLGQHLLIPCFPSPARMPFIPTALVIIIVIRLI